MAIALKVQTPASKPAAAPHPTVVLPAHESTRNIPRFMAIINEKRAVNPKILPLLPAWICSIFRLLSTIQALPNKGLEYQMPPTINADRAATIIASQLMCEKSIFLGFLSFN